MIRFPRAFPCWDEPGVKATFAVTLIVPAHLTALSNMPELSVQHIKGKNQQMLKKVVFDTSPKMSTYLLGKISPLVLLLLLLYSR